MDCPADLRSPKRHRRAAINQASRWRPRRLLFLGRIHPMKGVTTLLHAWSAIQHRFRDWELHVAGPDDNGHLADVRALVAGLKLERLSFPGRCTGRTS